MKFEKNPTIGVLGPGSANLFGGPDPAGLQADNEFTPTNQWSDRCSGLVSTKPYISDWSHFTAHPPVNVTLKSNFFAGSEH